MDFRLPDAPREKLESWLRYFEELNLEQFYLDRRPVARRAPRAFRAAEVPEKPEPALPGRAAPAASAEPASTMLPLTPAPSLFDRAGQLENETLEGIRTDLGDCTRCRLHKRRNSIVFGAGNPRAELMFVGEGPGHDEDVQGLPFVGRAGKLLTQMIEAMSLKREDVYIANVVKCRPPENRTPEKDESATCSPFLLRQIDVIAPKAIVCLGSVAAQTLLNTNKSISHFRGHWFDYRNSKLLATYHPAYLLRNPNAKGEVWKDLQKVMALLGLSVKKAPGPR